MPFFHQQTQSLAQEQREQEMDLFQLLSLLDSSSPSTNPFASLQSHPCAPRRHIQKQAPVPTFIPAFDILETASGYELFGEVPGLDVKTLDIQFSDAQTLVLKGLTARAAPSAVEAEKVEKVEAVQQPSVEKKAEKQASVEEDYDEVDTPLSTPSTTTTETPAIEAKKVEAPKKEKVQARYWLTERKIGSFARSFSFAQRIEIDDVKAELKEGVLHVVVPKSVKSKRVEVSVF